MTKKRRHRWGRGVTDIYSREIDECFACDTQRDIDPDSGKRVYLWRREGKWRFKCPPCIRETGLTRKDSEDLEQIAKVLNAQDRETR